MKRPSGQEGHLSATRSVMLSNVSDPFSVTSMSQTATVEGRETSMAYNSEQKRYTVTSPEMRNRTLDIDDRGRMVGINLPGVEPFSLAYTASGKVDWVAVGSGEEQRLIDYEYDTFQRMRSLTHAEGLTTTLGFDEANRLTTITYPDQWIATFGRDSMGNRTSVTPPGRAAHLFTYTRRNQLQTYTLPSLGGEPPDVARWFYDDDRRLERIVRHDGAEIVYKYELLKDRLEKMETPRGDWMFDYQADGKLDMITLFDGQVLDFEYDGPMLTQMAWSGIVTGSVERDYDPSLRLKSIKVNGSDPITYGYDEDSLVTSAGVLSIVRETDTGRIDTLTMGNVSTAWTYNTFGEPETVTTTFSADGVPTPLFQESFTYDKRGWIVDLTRVQNSESTTETFDHDNRGRLETVYLDGDLFATYGYDENSNRIYYSGSFPEISTTTYDERDRLISYGDTTYDYDRAGDLRSKSMGDQSVEYDYDVFGNLRRVTLEAGTTIDYIVDGDSRRVGKKVDGSLVKGWLYQGRLNPVAELDGDGNVVSRFVYASRTHTPDYMIKDGITYGLISDHLGSPRLVVDLSTGTLVQELRYDEFGRITLDTNPGFQPFGFAGGLYDHQTGLVRFGARDYDAEIGRWTTPDPIGFSSGTMNLYTYAGANPVNFVDLEGQSKEGKAAQSQMPRGGPYHDLMTGEDDLECMARIRDEVRAAAGDKNRYKHCLGNCKISRECHGGKIAAWLASAVKELQDVQGCLATGDQDTCNSAFQPEDFEDNAKGRDKCDSKVTCEEACKDFKILEEPLPGPFSVLGRENGIEVPDAGTN